MKETLHLPQTITRTVQFVRRKLGLVADAGALFSAIRHPDIFAPVAPTLTSLGLTEQGPGTPFEGLLQGIAKHLGPKLRHLAVTCSARPVFSKTLVYRFKHFG